MIPYRREIDGLRAVAVAAVVLSHAGAAGFSGGFVGVDVFFVISGYLITSIILAERDQGVFSLSRFYERRARRILPALFLTVLLCLPVAWILLPPDEMRDFSQSVAAVPLFATNMLFWREAGYFDAAAVSKPLLHTWSLAVEEQFYLVYPMLLLLANRLSTRRLASAFFCVIVVSFALAEWGSAHAKDASFFTLPFRAWELAVGAWLAVQFPPSAPPIGDSSVRQVGSVAGFWMIAFAVFAYDAETPFPGIYATLPVFGAGLIIVCAHPDTIIGRGLACRPMVVLGLTSYSAYLFHHPLMAFARNAVGPDAEGLPMLLFAGLSFLLAYMSWRYFELPCRNGALVSRKIFCAASVTVVLIFLVFGVTGHRTGGFLSQRLTPDQETLLKTAEASPARERCHTGGADFLPPTHACVLNQGHRKAAIFGDSHTVELAFVLADELGKHGFQVTQHSFSSCAPSLGPKPGTRATPCDAWSMETLSLIKRDDQIDLVVVSYRILSYLRGSGEVAPAPDAWDTLATLLRHLTAQGKQVVLTLQAPELSASIQDLVFNTNNLHGDIPGQSRVDWEDQRRIITARLSELPREVMVVDPSDIFCDMKTCNATKDGIALYFNDNHMSVGGARLVAKQVVNRISSVFSVHPANRLPPTPPSP
jgi:peptidoglycan/LPS O-acetylase OafA/YrhL